ncbi:mitochondrial transcription termination factor family protein [Actinidia rufa]|uniref:Mitochondrial transcription termination factor family protein n=1 Tax=Actinidia rufa TaxID=165716 RepID=A0A7J0FPN3_9ERIC|nr:mitochondrial transcription termination factor family protein [Actinidia rufa]
MHFHPLPPHSCSTASSLATSPPPQSSQHSQTSPKYLPSTSPKQSIKPKRPSPTTSTPPDLFPTSTPRTLARTLSSLSPTPSPRFLPPNKFFLCEDLRVLNVACALSGFGFPWNSLGKFYTEEVLIFGRDPVELSKNLNGFKEYGFSNVTVIGICLVFPYVLGGKPELGDEIDALFDDLRRVFVDFDLVSCVEGNVDAWVEVCRKIRVFYDFGCEKGKMGELMGRRKTVFLRYPEEVLVKQAEFFSKLSELRSIAEEYPYVLGRNKMANLPHVMRAMDLHEWFFAMMKVGNHCRLGTYVIGDPNEDLDTDYASSIEKIQFLRTPIHTLGKLDFLHSIGFGENNLTIKVLENLHGTSAELQERFECLLGAGIQFSKLCKIIRLSPKILSQNSETLVQKIKFLCEGMGFSLQYLDVFPTYLCYDLEKRIKPRYRFHVWLTEKGLCKKTYSPASMISTSEKNFLARISGMNPAAPKKWLEFISNQNHSSDCQGCPSSHCHEFDRTYVDQKHPENVQIHEFHCRVFGSEKFPKFGYEIRT